LATNNGLGPIRNDCPGQADADAALKRGASAAHTEKAAVEGRLPRGIGIERLRDPPTEWSRQFEALGLNPE
jgi:hypothetical protein